MSESRSLKPAIAPYAGRVGANQDIVLDPAHPENAETLEKIPDAGSFMSLQQSFSFSGFHDRIIWKAAVTECIATMMLVYLTTFISLREPISASSQQSQAGIYGTAPFLGALTGGVCNWIIVTLFIYAFAPVSGGHLNPTITIATFCARLTSFPRMIMYLGAQTVGAALGGLMLRASYGSTNFAVGGCAIDQTDVTIGEAFAMEYMGTLILLFLLFGVALDPRQVGVFGPTLAPSLAGLALGVISFGMSFPKPGVGVSMNAARCFGAFVGSSFPSYHWIHWTGPIAASVTHGIVYFLVPPWTRSPLISTIHKRDGINPPSTYTPMQSKK